MKQENTKNTLYSLDRFEGNLAVLVGPMGESLSVPRGALEPAVREGMLLLLDETTGTFCVQRDATQKKQEEIRARVQRLLHKKV